MEDKRSLRLAMLGAKMRLDKKQVDELSDKAVKRLIEFIDWNNLKTVHTYIPITANNELDSRPLIDYLRKNHPDIEIYLPKLDGFARFDPDTKIDENRLGIPEPEGEKLKGHIGFDLIIVPIIGFDRRGYRLGYGAGYYDRFLAEHKCKNIVGLAYSISEISAVPDEPHDKKMQVIVTDKEIIKAKN
ncbi:MAG TPA: 5-formyltetrahydrofolate cyclo-ligase [Candidatus Saccharimonadales bacterium]|nr:5-formyltetrahydrofolate cyclo-ligase [Candidatus Saccharimonadales bacterium]